MHSVNPLVQGQSARSGGKKRAEQGKCDLEPSGLTRLQLLCIDLSQPHGQNLIDNSAELVSFFFFSLFTDEKAEDFRCSVEIFK